MEPTDDDFIEQSALETVGQSLSDGSDAPDEVVVYIAEGRALVIGRDTEEPRSRWGRWLDSRPSAAEFRTLLGRLDQATRAYVESQAWIGRYVELDPVSRAMWGNGFKSHTDADGWAQANLRNEDTNRYARLMRVRQVDGVAAVANATAIFGAMAAQAEAAELAQTLNLISLRVSEVAQHQKTDQVGAIENVLEQVTGLVLRLREHGLKAVHDSEFGTIRNSLGDARRKALGHLRDAVTTLEGVSEATPVDVEKALGEDGVATASLYIELLGQLQLATLQLELGQVAVYLLQGKPDVAATWTTHIAASTEQFRRELEVESGRIDRLDATIRGQFQSAWKHALQPGDRAKEATVGTGLALGAAVKKLAGKKTFNIGAVSVPGDALVVGASAVGAAVGYGGTRIHNAVVQPRAQKSVAASLQQLADREALSFSTMRQAQPSLELLRSVAGELTGASEAIDLPE
jgi:hypothetical protein